jgi:(E)-4-hydroxy-3-methylbut-2-enyl-diphosphate synthase
MINRKITKQINVGGVLIGGGAPISIQTMTKTKTADAKATIEQINLCARAGADIVRVTVNDEASAAAMPEIVSGAECPVVADIHFNHVFALQSIAAGVAKVRINPGNIGSRDRIGEVLASARDHGIPIRIGVNSGSLEKDILDKYGSPTAEALFESAMRHIEIAEFFNFRELAVSVKSTSVPLMIASYRLLSERTDLPLHLGVTEAGTFRMGTMKSAIGIGTLLAEGIGDTIRVSLTESPEQEVEVAKDLLSALNLRSAGIEIISCPTCGRLEVDLVGIVHRLEESLKGIHKNVKVAVMGCVVNGPGEAKSADIGVACGKGVAILYRHGEMVKKIAEADILSEVTAEIMKF